MITDYVWKSEAGEEEEPDGSSLGYLASLTPLGQRKCPCSLAPSGMLGCQC